MNAPLPLPRSFRRISAMAAGALLALGTAFAAPLKVDINNTGRPLTEGLDTGFTSWSPDASWFAGGDTTAATFGGVTVTFTRTGSVGTALQPGYWKEGVQSATYNVKLTGDGLKVADGETGAQIEMRISGLTAGAHSLLLYLNSWDGVTSIAPLDILVNGTQVVDNLPVTVRVTDNNAAATSYLTFNAVAGQDTVIVVKADTAGTQTSKNVHINGFEIDTPNTKAQANNPSPGSADEHVNADAGTLTLSWAAATLGAASHNVYFGTSSSAVTNATTASAEYKGNRTTTTYPLTGLNSLLTYYWRIDEVSSGGAVTKGTVWYFRPRHLAFPGAEGYGRFARGGRGGVVVKVTNLNDTGAGSLRDAIEGDHGPRTVVFDVGGLITLQSDIVIDGTRPYITIAGQTAPGKGVTVKRQQLTMSGSRDVIFRYMRLLVGKESGETQNATGMAGVDHCIMDHVSAGWGLDEGLSTRGGKNLTFQRCSLSEALNVAGHQNYPAGTAHGYAASVGGDIASFHHNLLAHNEGRNWSLAGGLDGGGYYAGKLDIFNNVVYNWGGRTTDGGAHQVNFVNNYYKRGPANGITKLLNPQYGAFPGTQQYYMAGNVLLNGSTTTTNQTTLLSIGTENGGVLPQNSTPAYTATVGSAFFPSHATIHTATNAYKQVLSDVGCNQPQVDTRDARIVGETLAGNTTYTGSVSGKKGLPDTTADVGGWESYPTTTRASDWDSDNDGMPDWWETSKGLSTASPAGNFTEANADPDGDGYTNLEDYLNWMAAPHYDCTATVDVDIAKLTRGYTSSPVYTFSSPVNGTVALVGGKARFTATSGANTLGRFTFIVTDSAGDTMTQTVGIRILGSGVSAPSAPTGLSITAGSTQVSLTWTAASGATSYNIKRSTTSGGPYTTVGTTTGTSFTNTGLTNGTAYHYIVTAVNSGGESANSTQSSATPVAAPAVGLLAYEGFNYTANLNLSTQSGGTGWGLPWSNAAVNNGVATAGGLAYGTLPTSGGAGQFGGNASSTVVFTRRFGNTLGASLGGAPGAVWLSLLYRNTGDANAEARIGFYGGMVADANGHTSTSSTGLPYPVSVGRPPSATAAADQIYLYNGSSVISSGVATPHGSATALLLLKFNLSGGSTTADTLQLWVNPTLANGEAGLGAPQATWSTSADLEVINGIRLQQSAAGTVVIDEFRLGGGFASVAPQLAAPLDVVATPYSQQIVLGWSAVSGATSYRVKRATTSGGPYATVATVTTTSHIDTGLTNGTAYHYVVAAVNAVGEGAASAQVSVTPTATTIPTTTVQAEAGAISGGTFDSNNAGFNGTGFANLATTGGSLQFNNLNGGSGGAATLTIRFALGATTSRTGRLLINGVAQNITFAPTGAWTTWTTMNVSITLNAGSANTIRFETTGQDLANIDQITVGP